LKFGLPPSSFEESRTMQLVLMLVVCLAFLPYTPASPLFNDPLWSAALTWVGVACVGLLAKVSSLFFEWQLRHRPARRAWLVRCYGWVRFLHTALVVGLYLAVLFVLGWGAVVRTTLGLDGTVLLDELLILAPFLAALSLEWLGFYRTERALVETSAHKPTQPFWGRAAYLWYHLRFYLGLVLAPILIFTGVHEALIVLLPWASNEPWFLLASIGLLSFVILVLTPWLLKFLWHATPLPAGALRERLEAVARRLRFRYTDILLWNTRGGVANAMVTGVFRFPRYVLLSDGLVQGLQEDEVEAVFGHEIGHVKHHHMALYLAFMLLSLFLVTLAAQILLEPLPTDDAAFSALLNDLSQSHDVWTTYLGGVAILGGYVWLIFGFLSRRCERQADVYGCKAVSCSRPACESHADPTAQQPTPPAGRRLTFCATGVRTFIRALEKVADLNGIRRDKPSWRHGSIARRVSFLERLLKEPAVEPSFQRWLLLAKIVLLGVLAVSVCVLTALASQAAP
jgi:STE24 endopeptidase